MNKILYTIGGLGLLVVVVLTTLGPDMLQEFQEPTVKNSMWDDSVWQVEEYLEKNLKDPESYESIDWGQVIELPSSYIVHHEYRAKNSYGGYDIYRRSFTLNKKGEVIDVRKLQDSPPDN